MVRKLLALCCALGLVAALGACSSDDDETAADEVVTEESDGAGGDDAVGGAGDDSDDTDVDDAVGGAGDDSDDTDVDDADSDGDVEADADEGPCPSETTITIAGTDAIDGEMDLGTSFADVVLGATTTLVFATYEMEDHPQFGLRAPVGEPDIPDGGVIYKLTLVNDGDDLLEEDDYDSDVSEGRRIGNFSLWSSDGRVLPLADHVVTVTEITDDEICGEITAEDDPRFPTATGPFVLERIGS